MRTTRKGEVGGGLFGPEKPDSGENAHSQFVAHYADRFCARYGSKYPWRGRDFRHVADIIRAVGSIGAARAVADAYLADRDRRYDGHELRWLVTDLARFVARAGEHSRRVAGGRDATGVGATLGDALRKRP